MAKYECIACGYIYDEDKGDPENGVEPGTKWDDLPDDWVCPVCGVGKDQFTELDEEAKEKKMSREVATNIIEVGSLDAERVLFDELIPLPDGTSYNSYLVKGSEKIALIDTVDPSKQEELLNNLKETGIKKLDYIIANHAEQDHSGSIPKLLELYPEAKVVCDEKCKVILMNLLHIPEEKFFIIGDKQEISLGNKTLQFINTPWVHWPETMCTYLKEDKILFSCDFFGSHYASEDLFVKDEEMIHRAAKRYYAEIMMPFRISIKKNIDAIKDLKIEIIAPSHGQVYSNPSSIITAYEDWISDDVKNEVVLAYVSMHGSTKNMIEYFVKVLESKGITVKLFNLTNTDIGELAINIVDAATIVIGSPTFLAGPHPHAAYAAFLVNALRPKTRFVSVIGSYSWGGKMAEQLAAMIHNLKVEVINPVIIKGFPKEDDYRLLDDLANQIFKKHSSLG